MSTTPTTNNTNNNSILIIGAGISALTLAQGLHSHKIPFRIFERSPTLPTNGYRFRLVDEALSALQKTLPGSLWKDLSATHPLSSVPNFQLFDAKTLSRSAVFPAKEEESWPVDRPWVLRLLVRGIEDRISFGKECIGFEVLGGGGEEGGGGGRGVRVKFQDGMEVDGRMVIGADGIHSSIRRKYLPEVKLLDLERTIMWGRTPLTTALEAGLGRELFEEHYSCVLDQEGSITRSMLFAPVRWPAGGKISGFVEGNGVVDQEDYVFWALKFETTGEGGKGRGLQTQEGRREVALRLTSSWDRRLRAVFENMAVSSAIPVWSNKLDIPEWGDDDRVTFMGDAVHALAPSGGAGGVLAVLDAAELCDVLKGCWDEGRWVGLEDGLRGYQVNVRERAKGAIERGFENGKILWDGKDWFEYGYVE
ncbi:FAD/NAD(P)-binding domain-containing protein [Aspergillus sclerotiicarbonarius CBS 121057]|uniref:FAD/NAD(P)-binding domain-containing protein n=1 Tax=Aspergillus sclerotiicarbonarius (strain CBS 121057 / IBT 28362) TaxID=1448318 RepID=A0A319E394_ASPSB|nr:FAD/NAD(P)-binding domain-containing protein [Aspergillus sclerotiicarbonarius CBS 121057]